MNIMTQGLTKFKKSYKFVITTDCKAKYSATLSKRKFISITLTICSCF